MRDFTPEKTLNIVLGGHSNSGKTSLVEGLLYLTGTTDRLGSINDKNTVSDFDPEEIKRQHSVSLSLLPVEYENHKLNFIDTPGQFDFEGVFLEGARAAESALITVSGKSGCAVGTVKALRTMRKAGKAAALFIAKLDNAKSHFDNALKSLQNELGSSVLPLMYPAVEDEQVVGYIDVLTLKAYKNNGFKKPNEFEADLSDAQRARGTILEKIAETDEALMEKFFEGEEFTPAEISTGLHNAVLQGLITPVFTGSGHTGDGLHTALSLLTSCMPRATDGREKATVNGEEVVLNVGEDGPLAAFVFKTIVDPFVGKFSFVKVIRGKLSSDLQPFNTRTGAPEKLGKLVSVRGKKQDEIKFIGAGDIGAITKLSAKTGDTLCDAKHPAAFPALSYPTPSLSMGIRPVKKGDEAKVAQGMQKLSDEDPTLVFGQNRETRQQLISGLGDQQLEVAIARLKSRYSVDAVLEAPIIPYRETIRKKVKAEGKHKKQSGGHGQFGHVWVEFEPIDAEGLVFEEKVFGGSVPKNFFPAVEKGLQDSIGKGMLAGYPMVGIKATLVDGSYHPVDSSEMSFKLAAAQAYRAGVPAASPLLLEPIGKLSAHVPDSNTGDLMGELNKRRGRVLGMNPSEDKLTCIEAEVPMSEMSDFSTFMRSLTQGRGHFVLTFERYEPLPSNLEAEVIEQAKKLFADEKAS